MVLFWRAKKNEVTALQQLSSDKKIFRVLTGSCRGGTMESRRGEKTFKIYPPSARRTHHRDKVQSIPAVVAEERSGTTASHRKIFLADGTPPILRAFPTRPQSNAHSRAKIDPAVALQRPAGYFRACMAKSNQKEQGTKRSPL